jgi:predicted enzyme related to lactoylglutathione lyase
VPNPFVHIELLSTDMGKARSFYGDVFDWKFNDDVSGDGNPYVMLDVGGNTGANFMDSPIADPRPFWLPYVQVEDIQETLEAVRSRGGTVVRDRTDEPGMGSFAIVRDPVGAAFGLVQFPTA